MIIGKSKFVDILNKMDRSMRFETQLYRDYKADLSSTPCSECLGWLFDELISVWLKNTLCCDIFNEWYFSYDNDFERNKEITVDDKKYTIQTIEKMYDFLKENDMFRDMN